MHATILLVLVLSGVEPAQRIPFSDPPKAVEKPLPAVSAPAPAIDREALAQSVAGAIAQPIADAVAQSVSQAIATQSSAQTSSVNAALAQLTEAVAKLSDAQTKSDERRSADAIATRALLASMPPPALPPTQAERPPTATTQANAVPYQPGVRPAQSDCAANCPGPEACGCPCAVALKATRLQLQAAQAKQAAPPRLGRFAGKDDSGQWYYSDDHRSVAATVARENRRLRGEDVGDPMAPVMVPVRRSAYTTQASYSDSPATYSMPTTYAPPVASYSAQAPMLNAGYAETYAAAPTVTYGSGSGGLFGGRLFTGGGLFSGGLFGGSGGVRCGPNGCN